MRKKNKTGSTKKTCDSSKKTLPEYPSEHDEQVGFVDWFRANFPGVLIYAIPNGGRRSISVAKELKAEGVVRGVLDLHVPAWGLWVEMKRVKGGRLSPEQIEMIDYLNGIGHSVVVGIGARDASRQVLEFVKGKS